MLDETDSGLDIDALKTVAAGVNALRREDRAFVVITHYQRLLNYIVPDHVHVLLDGRIVRSGGSGLALELEERGYAGITEASAGGSAEVSSAAGPATGRYLDLYSRRTGEAGFLRALRQQAIGRFEAAGFPTSRDEEWRQTNLGPLLRAEPEPAARHTLRAGEAAPFLYPDCHRMIFVNGRYAAEASSPPERVTAVALADLPAGGENADAIAEHLGATACGLASCSADARVHAFAALNTALSGTERRS